MFLNVEYQLLTFLILLFGCILDLKFIIMFSSLEYNYNFALFNV